MTEQELEYAQHLMDIQQDEAALKSLEISRKEIDFEEMIKALYPKGNGQEIPEWVLEKYPQLTNLIYLDTQAEGREGNEACEESDEFICELCDEVMPTVGFYMEGGYDYDEEGEPIVPFNIHFTDSYGYSAELYKYPNGQFAFKGFYTYDVRNFIYMEIYSPEGELLEKWYAIKQYNLNLR